MKKTSHAAPKPFAGRYYNGGPIPATGTPQDRFAAVIGRSNNHIVPSALGMIHSNPPALPSFAAITGHITPSGTAANALVAKDNNAGTGGNGPALPPPNASVTQWLSYECQRRHFNPEFKASKWLNKAGEARYQCTVMLQDRTVHGDINFDNPLDAKIHVADKALKQLRGELPKTGHTRWRGQTLTRANGKLQTKDSSLRQESLRRQPVHRHKSRSAEMPQPSITAPSSVDMNDPVQARAFVEGFKMGQVASQGATAGRESLTSGTEDPDTRQRNRSRSPTAHKSSPHSTGVRRHRHRSPLRGAPKIKSEFSSPLRPRNIGRHEPPLPSTDRYRPWYDGVENQYGRLREFNEGKQGH